ncbi:MAG: hypothetical protein QM757_34220 [Paludibaculum sp.]
MIISMRKNATRAEIDSVIQRIEDFGYKIHTIEGEERVVIGAIGVGDTSACLEALEAMNCVEKAVRISAPYKFVSWEFQAWPDDDNNRRQRPCRELRIRGDGRPVLRRE